MQARYRHRCLSLFVALLLAPSLLLATVAPASALPPPPQTEPGVSDSIVRLYLAVFDRRPDTEGGAYWLDRYEAGVPLNHLAAAFMVSAEWQARYGTVDDDRFVELLYAHVLKREPDPEGRQYWIDTLAGPPANQGAARTPTRAEILVLFSESTEFVRRTGTTPPVPPTLPFPALPEGSGFGRRIVYGNSAQRVWMVNADGSVHDSYLVSGRRDTPGPGTYSVFSKSAKAYAGHDGITMDHMVRFARGRRLAIGFHSIPAYASGRLLQGLGELGTYQSAGCVRQEAHKAEALFHWADVGTTVVVLD